MAGKLRKPEGTKDGSRCKGVDWKLVFWGLGSNRTKDKWVVRDYWVIEVAPEPGILVLVTETGGGQ